MISSASCAPFRVSVGGWITISGLLESCRSTLHPPDLVTGVDAGLLSAVGAIAGDTDVETPPVVAELHHQTVENQGRLRLSPRAVSRHENSSLMMTVKVTMPSAMVRFLICIGMLVLTSWYHLGQPPQRHLLLHRCNL